MKNYTKVAALILGGMLVGCGSGEEDKNNLSQNVKKQNMTSVIQEYEPGKYKVIEEYQSSSNRIILIDINGNEKILSQAEIDELLKIENEKVQNGTSNLTNASMSSGGLSLGEAILASATGMIIGSWIGNRLFSNPNYQGTVNTQRQEIRKNVNSFNKTQNTVKSSSKSSGFFNQNKSSGTYKSTGTSSSRGFFGG